MAIRNPQALLERALALPNADSGDFTDSRHIPVGVDPQHLKKITDTALRSRLIGVRLAAGLQSPKGAQKIASILRIYPDFTAPVHVPTKRRGGHFSMNVPRKLKTLPTIEEMEALITRIRALEGHAARELHMSIDGEIEQLKRRIGETHPDHIDEAYRALGDALAKRNDSSTHVREEALRRIEQDHEFAPRAYVKLLARGLEPVS